MLAFFNKEGMSNSELTLEIRAKTDTFVKAIIQNKSLKNTLKMYRNGAKTVLSGRV